MKLFALVLLLSGSVSFAGTCPTRANIPGHYRQVPKTLDEHLLWASRLTATESCSRREVVLILAELDDRHREFEMKALQNSPDGLYPQVGDVDHTIAVVYLKLANAVKLRRDLLDGKGSQSPSSGAQ